MQRGRKGEVNKVKKETYSCKECSLKGELTVSRDCTMRVALQLMAEDHDERSPECATTELLVSGRVASIKNMREGIHPF